jgi:hypothetical protein
LAPKPAGELPGSYDAIEYLGIRAKTVVAFYLSGKPSFADVLAWAHIASATNDFHVDAGVLMGICDTLGVDTQACHHAIHTAARG